MRYQKLTFLGNSILLEKSVLFKKFKVYNNLATKRKNNGAKSILRTNVFRTKVFKYIIAIYFKESIKSQNESKSEQVTRYFCFPATTYHSIFLVCRLPALLSQLVATYYCVIHAFQLVFFLYKCENIYGIYNVENIFDSWYFFHWNCVSFSPRWCAIACEILRWQFVRLFLYTIFLMKKNFFFCLQKVKVRLTINIYTLVLMCKIIFIYKMHLIRNLWYIL